MTCAPLVALANIARTSSVRAIQTGGLVATSTTWSPQKCGGAPRESDSFLVARQVHIARCMRWFACVLIVSFAATAAAETPVAVSVNPYWSWALAKAFGASINIGVTHRLAVRASFARYSFDYTNGANDALVALAGGDDGPGIWYEGSHIDVSAGLLCYLSQRSRWSGLALEGGLMHRIRNVTMTDWDDDRPLIVETHSSFEGARLLVVASWVIAHHVFVAAGVGASLGYEHGHETTTTDAVTSDAPRMPVTAAVGRLAGWPETYFRIGGTFSL